MKKLLSILALIYSFNLGYCQDFKNTDLNYEIFITNKDSTYLISNCLVTLFDAESVTLSRLILNEELNSYEYQISKYIFKDFESIKVRKKARKANPLKDCMAPGIIFGSIPGIFIGAFAGRAIKPKETYKLHVLGDFYMTKKNRSGALEGALVGGMIGGTIGACLANIKINIPLSDDKLFKRTKKLQTLCTCTKKQ